MKDEDFVRRLNEMPGPKIIGWDTYELAQVSKWRYRWLRLTRRWPVYEIRSSPPREDA